MAAATLDSPAADVAPVQGQLLHTSRARTVYAAKHKASRSMLCSFSWCRS